MGAVSSSAGSEGDVGWGEDVVSWSSLGPGAGIESINLHGGNGGNEGSNNGSEFHFLYLFNNYIIFSNKIIC